MTHLDRVGAGNELSVFAGRVADTTTVGTQTYTPVQVSTINTFDDDKQWLVADADPNSPFADNLYIPRTEFTGATRVMFSRSIDGGVNWSAPQQVSQAGEGFVWPAHAAVGSNGDVYLAYHTDTCGAANTGTVQLLRDGTRRRRLRGGDGAAAVDGLRCGERRRSPATCRTAAETRSRAPTSGSGARCSHGSCPTRSGPVTCTSSATMIRTTPTPTATTPTS
ncbi:hypothetical protein [Nocardioides sp. B-3]|uniref:hypothetical protein n=1 Tax=Nocardioides sp. B-3 TaxID=2895565 RepID=UPI002153105B|nr:hypothetical protein [Nocardioides sp. B-3]UUZ59126.1 hypothetical protein LP418_24820 [Nocardioides sp. B-3]